MQTFKQVKKEFFRQGNKLTRFWRFMFGLLLFLFLNISLS